MCCRCCRCCRDTERAPPDFSRRGYTQAASSASGGQGCNPRTPPARRWSKQLTWRCFLAAAVTIVVVRFSVEKCVDHGHCKYLSWASLIWFQQSFPTPYDQVRRAELREARQGEAESLAGCGPGSEGGSRASGRRSCRTSLPFGSHAPSPSPRPPPPRPRPGA
jgi:hypothetical protein